MQYWGMTLSELNFRFTVIGVSETRICDRTASSELLLNFLQSEDDYVEVSRLIKLFNTLG